MTQKARKVKDEGKSDKNIETLLLQLIPLIVDESTARLKAEREYWNYAGVQAQQFLDSLPPEYKGKAKLKTFAKEKSALYTCVDSTIDLLIGFRPGYNSVQFVEGRTIYGPDDIVRVPVYDLGFRVITPHAAATVLTAALQQFFVYQSDMDGDTVQIQAIRNKETMRRGITALSGYLPKDTTIQVRTDFGGGGGKMAYKV